MNHYYNTVRAGHLKDERKDKIVTWWTPRSLVSFDCSVAVVLLGGEAAELAVDAAAPVVAAVAALQPARSHRAPPAPAAQPPAPARRAAQARVALPKKDK